MRILSTVCRNMYGQMVLGVLTHAQAKGDTTMGEKTVVNSWNEWDPLKHVFVGRADDCHIPPEKSEVYQAEQMDKLGMEVVEVDLRDAYAFGGGLHCCTADVYREGACEDYFPNQ